MYRYNVHVSVDDIDGAVSIASTATARGCGNAENIHSSMGVYVPRALDNRAFHSFYRHGDGTGSPGNHPRWGRDPRRCPGRPSPHHLRCAPGCAKKKTKKNSLSLNLS